MPTLTHTEAALAARMLESYGETLLSQQDDDVEVVLENTPETRVLATAIIKQHDPHAPGCVAVADHILVNQVALVGYLRKRLLNAEVDCPECERCGMECGGGAGDDGMTDFSFRCAECDFQYCEECFYQRHQPGCPAVERLGCIAVEEGAVPES